MKQWYQGEHGDILVVIWGLGLFLLGVLIGKFVL